MLDDVFLLIFLFVLGAAWGSFLHALVFRARNKMPIISSRSCCLKCKRTLAWKELIPIASFLMLRGKCRKCGKRFSASYLLSELGLGLVFALGAGFFASFWDGLFYLAVVSAFALLFIYDVEDYVIPDFISLPAFVIIFFIQIARGQAWLALVLAAALGAGFFLAQFLISKGKWVGGGDIRLGLLLGVVLGYPLVLLAFLLAYVGGSALALLLIAAKKKTFKSRLPFATILLPAGLIALLWGEGLWGWYLSILGV